MASNGSSTGSRPSTTWRRRLVGRRAHLWETAAKRLRAVEARPQAPAGRHRASLPPPGSTWVTRPRPHIDRIASAWLIRRFYDADATFAFADAADAARKGIPFDVLGAEFGHHGEDCTFETLVKRFGVKDRRARVIAEIVHEADLHDGSSLATSRRGSTRDQRDSPRGHSGRPGPARARAWRSSTAVHGVEAEDLRPDHLETRESKTMKKDSSDGGARLWR